MRTVLGMELSVASVVQGRFGRLGRNEGRANGRKIWQIFPPDRKYPELRLKVPQEIRARLVDGPRPIDFLCRGNFIPSREAFRKAFIFHPSNSSIHYGCGIILLI